MLEAFSASSPKAKVLNVLYLTLSFLAWVCCCVSFGGELMSMDLTVPGGNVKGKFYWNYIKSGGEKLYFNSEFCVLPACSKCNGGGKGLIAMQVFAFIGLTAVLFMATVRILGASVSALEPTRKSLFLELTLTGINTFFFFLSVCIYGGACFHAAGNMQGASVTGTGFAYLIVCFFFLIACTVLVYMVRNDSSTHLGSTNAGAYASEHDATTTDYNPPASYQYNAETSAAAYAGSYNGDVMPSQPQQGDSNL